MQQNGIKIAGLALILAFTNASWAEMVEDLYAAVVPVKDVGQDALIDASREALAQVLVKVTGRDAALLNPVIVVALGESRSLVQRFAYARDGETGAELSAHFEFDVSVIARLIQQAGEPFWTANRPATMTWIVVEGPEGRQFLNSETAPRLTASLSQEFGRRGIPIRMPLYDIDDAAAIDPDELWGLRTIPLREASQRYGGKNILAGRVAVLSNGDWLGEWAYLSHNSRVDRSIKVDDASGFFKLGSALVAEQMSARFAVATSVDATTHVRVKVAGVSSYSDYADIVQWLQGLELIDNANITSIRGDVIRLNLSARADGQSLATTIGLNTQLQSVPTVGRDEELSYQWQN